MKTTPIAQLEAEIRNIQAELQALGPMHPGSISKQYQVCGRTGCRCQDVRHPQRHGPYHKLAYVYRGKPVCRFVRAGTEDQLTQRLAVYKRFRGLIDRWIALSIQRGVLDFFTTAANDRTKAHPLTRPRRRPRA
jgi:hypothetical protein